MAYLDALTHLDALMLALSLERSRLEVAKRSDEIELRTAWVLQLEKEVADEKKFLGIEDANDDLTSDELLAALGSLS